MNKQKFLKDKFIEALSAGNLTKFLVEQADNCVTNNFIESNADTICETFSQMESSSSSVIVKGVQGSGKTLLLDIISQSLNENVHTFYISCNEITTLDDIFLELFKNIYHSHLRKELDIKTSVKNQSIDEKIINFLKKIKTPFLFIFDSFENLFNSEDETLPDDISNFLYYISTLPTTKILIASRYIRESALKLQDSDICAIRLSPLDEDDARKFLKCFDLDVSEHLNYEIYKATKGYLYNIKLFVKVVEKLGVSPFDILKEYSVQKLGSEEFLIKKLYSVLPNSSKKLLWHLCSMRHKILRDSVLQMSSVDNAGQIMNALIDYNFIEDRNGIIFVKDFIKSNIYELVPNNEKIQIHKYFNKFYSDQIPLKPSERLVNLSRNSMHTEKFYHYTSLSKLEKNYQSISTSAITAPDNNVLPNTPENIKYISTISQNVSYSEKPKSQSQNSSQIFSTAKSADNIQIVIDDNLNVSLSDEEKALLDNLGDTAQVELISEEPISEESSQLSHVEENLESSLEEILSLAEKAEINDNYELSMSLYDKALDIFEMNPATKAHIIHKKGMNLHKLGYFEQAYIVLKKALSMYESLQDTNSINLVNLSLGKAYSDSYKYVEAIECFNNIFKSPNHPANNILTEASIEVADIYEYKRQYVKALELYKKALLHSIEMNNKPNISKIYFKIALICDDSGEVQEAIESYQKCIKVSENPDINKYIAAAYSNLASILEEDDNEDNAILYYQKAHEVDEKLNNYEGQFKSLSSIANIYLEKGDITDALKFFNKELQVAKKTNDAYYIATGYLEIGDAYFSFGNYENALKAYIISRKSIDHTISVDSRLKIEKRFKNIVEKIGEKQYSVILEKLRKK